MSPLLEVNNLEVAFLTEEGKFTCIDRVNFSVNTGEILCIVGESGSGKSVTSLSIMGLLGSTGKVTNGSILYENKNLLEISEKELDNIRGNEITMIFQDAMTSLNPVLTIGMQMVETMTKHLLLNKSEAKERAISLLKKVGLSDPGAIMKKYPHTLSGGMRQRVMIAMALTCNPKLLIADEPTTALDVTIQAQILKLLRDLNKELGMSLILITHDLGVVAQMAERVLVMYAGQFVEEANVKELFLEPKHPYTKALLKSIPNRHVTNHKKLIPITGTVPEKYPDITGCRFANRCPYAVSECESEQYLIETKEKHYSRCFRSLELSKV